VESPILLLAREVDHPARPIIATDAQGRIIYWGIGAETMFGWERDEVIGRNIVDITPADLSREEAADIMRALAAGLPWSGEFVVQTKDGSRRTANITDIPFYDRRGRLLGILGITRRSSYAEGP
jgi:PAS domain S-box-containing protein